jgi:Mrp family chromosome partitioning ATPase
MSKRAAETLDSLRDEGYLVLLDAPPVLPVTDAAVLSRSVDATVLVCAAGQTSGKEASRAVELLQQVNAPLVGTVLNGVSADGAYGYDYKYRYSAKPDDVPRQAPVKVRK